MPEAPIIVHCQIVKGDSYPVAEGRALQWFSPEFPDLGGALLELVVGYGPPVIYGAFSETYKYTMLGDETRVALMELTTIQTSKIEEGCYDYSLIAHLSSGAVRTLATGQLTVLAAPNATPESPL
jgi:hypothetical protein